MADKISVIIDVDPESFVFSIAHSMNSEELFSLIMELDDFISEYDFTERLRDHFAEIIRKEDEAIAKEKMKSNNEKS